MKTTGVLLDYMQEKREDLVVQVTVRGQEREFFNEQEKLHMVDAAEQYLLDLGFHQLRVRIHGDVARIELLPAEFGRFMEETTRLKVYKRLKELGFHYVTLDLLGYRTGSMNEVLPVPEEANRV